MLGILKEDEYGAKVTQVRETGRGQTAEHFINKLSNCCLGRAEELIC